MNIIKWKGDYCLETQRLFGLVIGLFVGVLVGVFVLKGILNSEWNIVWTALGAMATIVTGFAAVAISFRQSRNSIKAKRIKRKQAEDFLEVGVLLVDRFFSAFMTLLEIEAEDARRGEEKSFSDLSVLLEDNEFWPYFDAPDLLVEAFSGEEIFMIKKICNDIKKAEDFFYSLGDSVKENGFNSSAHSLALLLEKFFSIAKELEKLRPNLELMSANRERKAKVLRAVREVSH